MPRSGKQDVQAVAARVPMLNGFGTEAWELKGAEILQLSFEVVEDPADWLVPPALNPSIPPYVTLSVARFPNSPVGSFLLAQVRVIVRAGIRPRGYLLGAYTTSDQALHELQGRWGFTVGKAEITIDPRHDCVVGRVVQGGQTILDMELENPELVSGADIMYLDSMHLVRTKQSDKESLALIQVDPEYVIHNAQRGKPRLRILQSSAWGGENRLGCTNPIAATYTRCDTDLPKIRFALDPNVEVARGRIKIAA